MRSAPRSTAVHARRADRAGFSLVEVLVAMALCGLVLGALAMVTAQWLPAWQRGLGRVQQSELLGLALDRMAADLALAQFVPAVRGGTKPLFQGEADRVVFVREALGPNARPGLEVVELAPAGGSMALARRAAAYGPGEDAQDLPPFGPPVGLLRAPFRVGLSYAGRDAVWRDGWSDAEELPRAVRLVVRDGKGGRALAVSTAVVIRAELPASCAADATTPMCGQPLAGGRPDGDEAEAEPQPGAGEDDE